VLTWPMGETHRDQNAEIRSSCAEAKVRRSATNCALAADAAAVGDIADGVQHKGILVRAIGKRVGGGARLQSHKLDGVIEYGAGTVGRSRCPVPHRHITPNRELATRAIEYCPDERRVT
jgi:hypothetical protein